MVSSSPTPSFRKDLLFIGLVSAAARFFFFGFPASVVFDEVHFGKFISGYLTGNYFFDIHPPLAKLLLAGMAWLGGFLPTFSFDHIGQLYPDSTYLWLRILPALAGTLVPLFLYAIARELQMRPKAALAVGLLAALENAFIVESRFLLTDSLLFLFETASLFFILRWKNQGHTGHQLLWAGLAAGCAISVKWTGAAFLGLTLLVYGLEVLHNRQYFLRALLKGFALLIVVPAAVYYGVFLVHFNLLWHSGPGDAFQTSAFQKTLAGNPWAADQATAPADYLQKFLELNRVMFTANSGLNSHPYASTWQQWPLMQKPILYWVGTSASNQPERIYLVGNPFIWLAGLFSLGMIGLLWLWGLLRQPFWDSLRSPLLIVFLGYAANFLPFMDIHRVMFLYHYLPALMFALLALGLLLGRFLNWVPPHLAPWVIGVVLICGVLGFVVALPPTYGAPVGDWYYSSLRWLLN